MRKHYIIGTVIFIVSCFICFALIFDPFKPNINTIPDKDLETALKKVKSVESLASKIVQYRNDHYPIKIEWLDEVRGIGPDRIKNIKNKFKD